MREGEEEGREGRRDEVSFSSLRTTLGTRPCRRWKHALPGPWRRRRCALGYGSASLSSPVLRRYRHSRANPCRRRRTAKRKSHKNFVSLVQGCGQSCARECCRTGRDSPWLGYLRFEALNDAMCEDASVWCLATSNSMPVNRATQAAKNAEPQVPLALSHNKKVTRTCPAARRPAASSPRRSRSSPWRGPH